VTGEQADSGIDREGRRLERLRVVVADIGRPDESSEDDDHEPDPKEAA
jgi:hypothetical protein